jgi:hypothetical protein
VVEQVENPADAGSSLTLDALKDVTAPANTPAGKFIGTTAVGEWGPVDSPADTAVEMLLGANQVPNPWQAQAYASGQLVAHPYPNGVPSYWWAVRPAAPTDVPGVSAAWQSLNMSGVSNRVTATQNQSIPMDPTDAVHQWDPTTHYHPFDLAWTETDGRRYYYSSDIDQTGGTAPSPDNVATWTMISGVQIMWASGLTTRSMRTVAAGMWKKWTGTQAAYDALAVKDPGTLYAITG